MQDKPELIEFRTLEIVNVLGSVYLSSIGIALSVFVFFFLEKFHYRLKSFISSAAFFFIKLFYRTVHCLLPDTLLV